MSEIHDVKFFQRVITEYTKNKVYDPKNYLRNDNRLFPD